jgi:tRNA threonylcarbamoyladenosine biosynthesis protein TsaE
MEHQSFRIDNLDKLSEAAEWLWSHLKKERLLAFEGEMGAGKTTIIQALCKLLGVRSEVTSPTFALVNEYPSKQGFAIYHFDFYRIDDPIEALDFGLEEYLSSGGLCLMEWSEKVEVFLPKSLRKVLIEVMPDQARLLQLA